MNFEDMKVGMEVVFREELGTVVELHAPRLPLIAVEFENYPDVRWIPYMDLAPHD